MDQVSQRRIEDEFARLIQKCSQLPATWRTHLPHDVSEWDPYVRLILQALALQNIQVQEHLDNIVPRFWHELSQRLAPELLEPVVSRAILRFSNVQSSTFLGAGTLVTGKGNDRKTVRFATDYDLTALPLTIKAAFTQGDCLYLGLDLPESADSLADLLVQDDGSVTVSMFLQRDRVFGTMLDPVLWGRQLTAEARVNGDFKPVPVHQAAGLKRKLLEGKDLLSLYKDEHFLIDVILPRILRREGLPGSSERLLWIRLHVASSLDLASLDWTEASSGSLKIPPVEINCVPASNIYSADFSVLLDKDSPGVIVLDRYVPIDSFVKLERVSAGNVTFSPLHTNSSDTFGTYYLDWFPEGELVPQRFTLILNARNQDRGILQQGSANIGVFLTDGLAAANLREQTIGTLWEKPTDLRLVTVENITRSSPFHGRPDLYRNLADWVALNLRSGGRCITRRDVEVYVLGRFGRYVSAVRVNAGLSPDHSGRLSNDLNVLVTLSDKLGQQPEDATWLIGLLRQCLQFNCPPSARIRVMEWQ